MQVPKACQFGQSCENAPHHEIELSVQTDSHPGSRRQPIHDVQTGRAADGSYPQGTEQTTRMAARAEIGHFLTDCRTKFCPTNGRS